MQSRLSLGLGFLAALIAACLSSCDGAFLDRADEAAFERLDAVFSDPAPREVDAEEGLLFRHLLSSRAGRAKVRRLALEHDAVAYDEARNAVYFVHPRLEAGGRSCLGSVVMDAEDGRPILAHAGVPGFLRLESLRLEGDELTVRVAVSEDPGDRRVLEVFGFARGGTYDRSVSLERTAGREVGIGTRSA